MVQMNKRFKYLFKNIGILTISNFSSKILVVLLVPLYTSILSTKDYGTYDLSMSTVQLLYPVLTANIVDAVMRFSMDKKYSNGEVAEIGIRYIGRSILMAVALTVCIQALHLMPTIDGLELLILLYYASYVLNQYFVQLAKGMEKVSIMAIAGVIGTLVMTGTNLLLLLVFKLGLKGFYLAHILSQTVPIIYYILALQYWKIPRKPIDRKRLSIEMKRYSVPLIFTTVGWWANNAADKYVVAFICDVSANGILSVAYKIPQILNVVQGIFIQAWHISAVKECEAKDAQNFYGITFIYVNILMSVCCAGFIFLNRFLARFLYANDFYIAWRYVPFLLISNVVNTASGFIGSILSAKKDSSAMAKSAIYGTGANIVMNVVLVYLVGIQGATIATLLSSYIIYRVRLRSAKELTETAYYWKVIATWVLLCAQAAVEIYSGSLLVELGLMTVVLLLNLNVLKKVFFMGLQIICGKNGK